MVAAGSLTRQQADQMQQSISEINSERLTLDKRRRTLPVTMFAVYGAGAILTLVIFGTIIGGGFAQPDGIQNVSEAINTVGEVGKMRSSNQTLLLFTSIIGIPVVLIALAIMFIYNGLVTKEEDVLASWAQVESNLQRRADLIPNLVTGIKAYMEHEKDVFSDVTQKRSGGLSEIVDSLEDLSGKGSKLAVLSEKAQDKLSDETFMKAFATEQQQIGRQLNKLMGVVENYPDLKSSDQFIALQAQLEGTENRINVTRMVFNDLVGEYNASIRKIPGSFVAGIGNYKRKAYFQVNEETAKNIELQF
jgi:LemA protein